MGEINTTLGKYKGAANNIPEDVTCNTLKSVNESNEKVFSEDCDESGNRFTEKYCEKKEDSHTFATMFLKDQGEIFESYSDLAGRSKAYKETKIAGQNYKNRTLKDADGKYSNTKLCDGSEFAYNGDPTMLGGHTEARFLTELAGLGDNPKFAGSSLKGKKIVFNILWKNKNGDPPNAPCKDCFKMMCNASAVCGAEIEVCGEDGQPYSIEEDCANSNKDMGYDSFIDKITNRKPQPNNASDF